MFYTESLSSEVRLMTCHVKFRLTLMFIIVKTARLTSFITSICGIVYSCVQLTSTVNPSSVKLAMLGFY